MSSEDWGEQGEQALVPKLRFPEFREAAEWSPLKLNRLLFEPKKRNRDLKYGPEHVLSVSGEYGCVNQIEFMGRSYAGVTVKDYHIVETGDLVYTKSPLKAAPYGIIKANKGEDGIVSTLYAVYRPTTEASAEYLDHYFSVSYNLNSYLQPLVKKGAKNDMKVNNSDVLTGTIYAPDEREQQKIAECLSSLDAVIAVEGEQLAALKDHKKGLMQALFPSPGQTTPRLRFHEFEGTGRWERKRLDQIAEVNPSNGGLPAAFAYIDLGAVEGGKLNAVSVIERDAAPSRAQRLLEQGDILFQTVRPYQRNNLLFDIPSGDYVASTGYAQLRALGSKDFLYQSVHTDAFVDRVLRECAGSNYPAISSSDLARIDLPIPAFPEQQKIAECLSSLDAVIAAQGEGLAALKDHKKALMQQLFLAPGASA